MRLFLIDAESNSFIIVKMYEKPRDLLAKKQVFSSIRKMLVT